MNFRQLYQESTVGESGPASKLIAGLAVFSRSWIPGCILNGRAFRLDALSFEIQTQIKSRHAIGSFFDMFNFDISSINIYVAIQ